MIDRRELLRNLGIASAATLLWACGPKRVEHAVVHEDDSTTIRGWLRDAVARLALAYPTGVHALAVQRRHTAAAVDVIGAGVARTRSDAVILTVRDRDGRVREHMSSELSAAGITALVRALLGPGATGATKKVIDFGREPVRPKLVGVDPRKLDDRALRERAERLVAGERSSRIVYAAGLVEIDDATVWSVAPGRDLEQRSVRVRRTATRVAWSGTRPVVSEVELGYAGGVDDATLLPAQLDAAAAGALEIMTPATFADGTYAVVLAPTVAASAIDAVARGLMTSTAARRPEVARRLAPHAQVASPAITLVDDPTVAGAYGGFAFDDAGEPAAKVVLVEGGVAVGRLDGGRTRRPGHAGAAEVAPSHLVLAPGAIAADKLIVEGVVLDGARGTTLDPSSGKIVVAAARAREIKGGQWTGRVFADVELVGDLGVLGTITATSAESATVTYRDEVDGGLPRWRSVQAPWIAARGLVRGRGGAAS